MSILTVMPGLAALEGVDHRLRARHGRVVVVDEEGDRRAAGTASLLLLPRLPALQPAANSVLAAARATSATPRRPLLLNLMEPPGLDKTLRTGAGSARPLSEAFQCGNASVLLIPRQPMLMCWRRFVSG